MIVDANSTPELAYSLYWSLAAKIVIANKYGRPGTILAQFEAQKYTRLQMYFYVIKLALV